MSYNVAMKMSDFKMSLFWQAVIIFCISFFIFSLAQFPHTFLDPDAFYHAKISEKIAQDGIIQDFPWMQVSTLKNNYIDHHLGFHLLVAPITKFIDKAFALKLVNLFINSAFVTLFYLFLKKQRIKYSLLYIILIFLSTPLFGRLSLNKASGLSLILLLLFVWALYKKKPWQLFIISALYLYCYGGWAIIFIFLFVYCLSRLFFGIIEKRQAKKIFNKKFLYLMLAPIGGIIAALIVNPYFPKNIYFYWQQIVQIGLINYQDKITVGAEWYPYDFFNLIIYLFFLWGLFIFSLMIVVYQKAKPNWKHFFWIFLSLIFFVATLKSGRYIEYFIPIFIIAIAYLLNENKPPKPIEKFPKQILAYFIFGIIFATGLATYNFASTVISFQNGHQLTEFKQASQWIKEYTEPHSIIFHTDWDEFPQLWYHNDQNYYLNGLDPTFSYTFDNQLHQKWAKIIMGEEADNLYKIIKNDFSSDYIFVEKKNHEKFLQNLENNFLAEKKYEDDESAIFYLKDYE